MKRTVQILIFVLLGLAVLAQPVKQPVTEFSGREWNNALYQPSVYKNHRLEAIGLIAPFLESFNYSGVSEFNNNWEPSGIEIVRLTDSPALYGVKFNGIRADKTRYSEDSLLRVKTDSLVSKPVNSNGYFSDASTTVEFVWQGGGEGLQPDSADGDSLVFYMRDKEGKWNRIWKSPSADKFDRLQYYRVVNRISNPLYAYDSLRFKFVSYGPSSVNASAWYISNLSLGKTNSLPFWDDFSNASALRTHFKTNTGVYINNHLALNQPSINVATFDGVDDLGRPYYRSSVVEMGMADSLVSWPINLDPLSAGVNKQDSLRFSFFYQRRGLGEEADLNEGDSLVLLFYNKNQQWRSVWHSSFTEATDSSEFNQVMLTVNDSLFFHENFKFKFFNYARLSGAFDSWHLDYITMDTIRTRSLSNVRRIVNGKLSFSDLAVSRSPSGIVNTYQSVPSFHLNPQTIFKTQNNFTVSSLTPNDLLLQASENVLFNGALAETANTTLTVKPGITLLNQPLTSANLQSLIVNKDPFTISVKVQAITGNPQFPGYPFQYNDTAISVFNFSNYYAYDDGTYEVGEMLEQAKGAQALGFDFLGEQEDVLLHIDICIPYIGYNIAGSRFAIKVWDDAGGKPGKELYSRNELVRYSTGRNPFTRYSIQNKVVPIKGRFYIGYQQTDGFSKAVRIGYDLNNDNKSQLWYDNNQGNGWSQFRIADGTLMIRPVFAGKAPGQSRTETDAFSLKMYPNPNNLDYVNFNTELGWIEVIDFNFQRKLLEYKTNKVNITSLNPGIYFIKAEKNGTIYNDKLIIQAR